MFCQNCGHQLKENAKFCQNCGERLVANEVIEDSVNIVPVQPTETKGQISSSIQEESTTSTESDFIYESLKNNSSSCNNAKKIGRKKLRNISGSIIYGTFYKYLAYFNLETKKATISIYMPSWLSVILSFIGIICDSIFLGCFFNEYYDSYLCEKSVFIAIALIFISECCGWLVYLRFAKKETENISSYFYDCIKTDLKYENRIKIPYMISAIFNIVFIILGLIGIFFCFFPDLAWDFNLYL